MKTYFLFIALLLTACSSADPRTSTAAAPAPSTAPANQKAAEAAEGVCGPAKRDQLLAILRDFDPDGWRVYETDQRRGSRSQKGKLVFDYFFDEGCAANDLVDDVLSTAVHETVHSLRETLGGYDLIGGGLIPDPYKDSTDLVAPKLIANSGTKDNFVTNYLEPGQASSAEDFTYLLDELNAYAHDLETNNRIDGHIERDPNRWAVPRDGSLALMAFVKRYVEAARAHEPRSWAALTREPFLSVVRTLWAQSEKEVAENCRHARMGGETGEKYLKELREPAPALAELLGRPLNIPSHCL